MNESQYPHVRIMTRVYARPSIGGAVCGVVERELRATHQEGLDAARELANRLGTRVWVSFIGSDTCQVSPTQRS